MLCILSVLLLVDEHCRALYVHVCAEQKLMNAYDDCEH